MNKNSISWSTYKKSTDYDDDRQKEWTKCNSIGNLTTWFGKPGKDGKKKNKKNDMRPYITFDSLNPINSKNKTELFTFPELAYEFAKIMINIKDDEIKDVFRLLQRIRKPSLECDHIEANGDIVWSPSKKILNRINKIDERLLELLALTEAIARNEDVLYYKKKNFSRGRTNNVGTMILLIDFARNLNFDNEDTRKKWFRFTKRFGINAITNDEILLLMGVIIN